MNLFLIFFVCLFYSNAFYFHKCAFWQSLDCYCRTCRERRFEKCGIYFIHCCEIRHVCQINCCFDYMAQINSGFCHDLRSIGQSLSGLFFNTTFNEFTCSRIDRNLSGCKNKTVNFNRLAVRTDCSRSLFCLLYFHK